MQRILSSHHLRILIQFVFQQIESCNGKHQLFNLSRRLTFFLIILGSESKGGRSVAIRGYATFATRRSLAYDFLCAVERHGRSVGANPIRQLFAPAGSNRSSRGGNEATEASGVEGH